jgi:hypothetical protein
MILPNHAAMILVDGQSPMAVNALPAGTPTFSSTYDIDHVLATIEAPSSIRCPTR